MQLRVSKEEERAFFEKERRRIQKIVRVDEVVFYLSNKLTARGKTVILKELCVRFPGRVFIFGDYDRLWPCNPEAPSSAKAQFFRIKSRATIN
jgi:hypothetical protein